MFQEKEYYLTHSQKRVWYTDLIHPDSQVHNIGGCLKIKGSIELEIMQKVINVVINGNDGLRFQFKKNGDVITQIIADKEDVKIGFVDFDQYDESLSKWKNWVDCIFEKPFQLENEKLYYFCIYKLEDQYGILLKIHHIIADGWSISLIQKHLCEIYERILCNKPILTDMFDSYLDYFEYEKKYLCSERFIKDKLFWNHYLSDPPMEYRNRYHADLISKRKTYNLSPLLSEEIRLYAEKNECSLNTLFIALVILFLYKSTKNTDIVVGTPVFNRNGRKQKNMVGMFTNALPIRVMLHPEHSVNQFIAEVKKEIKTCFYHFMYPYDMLIKDLKCNKQGYDGLFNIYINYYNSKVSGNINQQKIEMLEAYCGIQIYPLQITIKEWDQNLSLNFDYQESVYTEKAVEKMYQTLIDFFYQLNHASDLSLKNFVFPGNCEEKNIISKWNQTDVKIPMKTVSQLFEEQVERTPDSVAAEHHGCILTYKQLNEKSNQIADFLKQRGLGRESIVTIMLPHSFELLISIFGVLKSGSAYLPIDPNTPIKRVEEIVLDSGSNILLLNKQVGNVDVLDEIIVYYEDIKTEGLSKLNPISYNGLHDLVYIIYTSGSSGKPKGVMVEHRGLTNYIWWASKTYLKDEYNSMALYSSISFDLTVTSIFTPLIVGGVCNIYSSDENEFVLYRILNDNKSTVIKLTPAHLALLKDMKFSNSVLKRLIIGGEDLKADLANNIYNCFDNNIEMYNEYGPTETVVGCMIYQYKRDENYSISVPIGHPIHNMQIYLLDNNLETVSIGSYGEMYISGEGVCRGYVNDKEMTSKHFVHNPFDNGRMYKTGDIGMYLEHGEIRYIGRNDNQVKIRGYRIELGEIELHLMKHKAVRQAVVVKGERAFENTLIAYVVQDNTLTEHELKLWLTDFLPSYMMPSNIVFLDTIPLTLSGKIDMAALPLIMLEEKEITLAETEKEKILIEGLSEVLKRKNLSLSDNYYQIGGDSITAILISNKIKNKGYQLKPMDILSENSLVEVASKINRIPDVSLISQKECEGLIENTPIVNWFFEKDLDDVSVYNHNILIQCDQQYLFKNVQLAAHELIKHHDTLRVNYDEYERKLFYNNLYLKGFEDIVTYIDLAQESRNASDLTLENCLKRETYKHSINNSLLFHITMFHTLDHKTVFLFSAHHLLVDGISWRIIMEDFFQLIRVCELDLARTLPLKTYSYQNWANALISYSESMFFDELEYWKAVETACQKEMMKEDYPNQTDTAEFSDMIAWEIEKDVLENLMNKSMKIYNVDLNEILIITLALSLHSITKQPDIVLYLERHGRDILGSEFDISRTVGWFTSIVPICFSVTNKDTDAIIKDLKEQLKNIPSNGLHYSILKYLRKELKMKNDKAIIFNYLGDFGSLAEHLKVKDIEFNLLSGTNNVLNYSLDITAFKVNGNLKLHITYSRHKFRKQTIHNLMMTFEQIMQQILEICKSKDEREFTPSDFKAVSDLSQDDLDALFY